MGYLLKRLFIDNIKGSRKLIDNGLHQYHHKGMENHMNTDQIGKTQWRSRNVRMSKKFWKHQRRTFGLVLECLDNENLEHLAMMERLLGPLPQHMIISADLRAEKYFKRSARLDWLEGASSKESTRAVWKLPRLQCFSGILRCLLYIGTLPTQPSDTTTDIPTPITTFENPKKNFKTQVRTPGVVARLMGLDSPADPRKGTFGQVLECLDNENLEHLAMMERLLGPLPQHMTISADLQ
ncbi:unnamed protein product [Camellia sinensis]